MKRIVYNVEIQVFQSYWYYQNNLNEFYNRTKIIRFKQSHGPLAKWKTFPASSTYKTSYEGGSKKQKSSDPNSHAQALLPCTED